MARRNVIEFLLVARDKTSAALGKVNKQFRSMSSSLVTVNRLLGAAFATGAAVKFGESVAKASDEVKDLQAQLGLLSGTSRAAFEDNIRIANEVGVAFQDTGKTFARFLIATQALDTTVGAVGEFTESIFKLGRIGGASMEEIKNTSLQVAQALASGRLQGDELRSTLENMPLLGQAIAEELGKSVGELKDLGAEGKITAEVVLQAVLENAEKIRENFEKMPRTLTQAREELKTEWTLTLAAFDESLKASEAFQFFARTLKESLQGIRVLLGSEFTDEERRAKVNRLLEERLELEEEISRLVGRRRGIGAAQGTINANRARIEAINKEIERLQLLGKTAEIERGKSTLKQEKKPVPITEAIAQAQAQISTDAAGNAFKSAEAAIEETEKTALISHEIVTKESKEAFDFIESVTDQAARNMQDAFADFLFDPFEDGLKGMLKSWIDTVRRMAAEAAAAQILSSLGITGMIASGFSVFAPTAAAGSASTGGSGFSAGTFGGARAGGGPVSPGNAYLVGEHGPEYFVPRTAGSVATGGGMNVTYNIDARGASVDLAKRLPDILEANNQQVLARVAQMRKQGGAMP